MRSTPSKLATRTRVIYLSVPSGAIVSAYLPHSVQATNAASVVTAIGMMCSADSARICGSGYGHPLASPQRRVASSQSDRKFSAITSVPGLNPAYPTGAPDTASRHIGVSTGAPSGTSLLPVTA